MTLDQALAELNRRLEGPDALKQARRLLLEFGQGALALATPPASVPALLRAAAEAQPTQGRRDLAVLLLHAAAVPRLLPPDAAEPLCAFIETALRGVLLRAAYPFGAPLAERTHALQRLHTRIPELLEPLQPTFPQWQGLYAG